MNECCGPFSTASRPRGVTLIEIVAGLVILGTLLVSVSIARARFLRQWAEADRKLTAIHAADQLMTQWMSGPAQNVPLAGGRPLGGATNFFWTTGSGPDPAARNLGALRIRLEIIDRAPPADAREPNFTVDFLIHDFRPQVNSTGGSR
jgi:prepilin-type N-terminal cleavage/methylation domain-containing protein